MSWRSFWNGPKGSAGPIAQTWNVSGWPTIYVLDAKGTVRYRDLPPEQLTKAIDKLLAEMEDGQREEK
jgi:hypothetical protein